MKRSLNKLVLFSEKEYTLHLLCKAIILKSLLKRGRKHVFTEWELKSGKITDVCDLDQRVFYEVERHPDKGYVAKLQDISDKEDLIYVLINLEKIPKHIKAALTELEDWLEVQIA
jgi:hypothetical protein